MRCKRVFRDYNSCNNPITNMIPSGQELIVIFIIILLLFGAKKLPELARGIGKSMGEFKKAKEEFEHEITRTETETRVKEVTGKEPRES